MFKTARFKIHNPSRHKRAMLQYALTHYHLTLKRVLEEILSDPDWESKIKAEDKKGRLRVNRSAISRLLSTIAPKGWALAPLRDYLIGDATAMLLSHFEKKERGKHESNPPTLPSLDPPTEAEVREAYKQFSSSIEFPLKPQQVEKIQEAEEKGHRRVAGRLGNVYRSWAATRAAGELLRKTEAALPHPIEFTRPEFGRGFLLAKKGNNYYLLVRLFADGHRYIERKRLDDGFIDCKSKEVIGGKTYPGVILPLELGRDYHEREYLEHGTPKSAKLLARKREDGKGDSEDWWENGEFYAHIAFEFNPEPIATETFLGIDRGAAMIGAGTIIDREGRVVADKIDLSGAAFAAEMKRWRTRIAELQRRGIQRHRAFRLRGRKADIAIGEYANRLVAEAVKHKSQIALEKIEGTAMARFLTQSQFRKLHDAAAYKAERAGLPPPVEVPPQRTSQTCARCGHWARANRPKKDAAGRAIQDVFRCVSCGYEANADDNASEVIALRALHQEPKGGRFQKFDAFQAWLKELKAGTA